MIEYSYRCKKCGHTQINIRSMVDSEPEMICEICGTELIRDFTTDHINTGNKDYAKPLVSHSMAVHPSQIPEHRKHFPDIEITSDGCPVLHSVQEHDSYLKRNNWDKAPAKKRKPTKKLPCLTK